MRVVNKLIYLALGVNMDGRKDLLGLWMSDNEGAKFWLSVLTELKSRGVQDIQNWRMALNRFTIEFGDRLPDHQ